MTYMSSSVTGSDRGEDGSPGAQGAFGERMEVGTAWASGSRSYTAPSTRLTAKPDRAPAGGRRRSINLTWSMKSNQRTTKWLSCRQREGSKEKPISKGTKSGKKTALENIKPKQKNHALR